MVIRHGWRLAVVVLALFGLLAGCGSQSLMPPTQKPTIVLTWDVVSGPRPMGVAAAGGGEVVVDARKIGRARTPVSHMMIRVTARLEGSDDPNPEFSFAVNSDRPMEHDMVSSSEIMLEPTTENKGVVVATYDTLSGSVPFVIFPAAFITAHPERYSGWVDEPVWPGINFGNSELVDIGEADLYVDERGELYAPYGWARLELDNADAAMAHELSASDLEFEERGAFGIAGMKEAMPHLVLPHLWIIKTKNGGFARVNFFGVSLDQDWEFVYEYSPTGNFTTH